MRYKMISAAVFFSIYMQGAVADPVDSNACSTTNSQSLIQAIGCGSIHGSADCFLTQPTTPISHVDSIRTPPLLADISRIPQHLFMVFRLPWE